jgi:hypothetical protein
VEISSLPNNICNQMMMEATLQQARLDEFVLSVVTKPGQPHGEAVVNLSTREAAIQCVCHFDGRRWGGVTVSARLATPDVTPPMTEKTSYFSADAPVFMPSFLSAAAAEFVPSGFSVDAYEFVPAGFSADAPAFIPAGFTVDAPAFIPVATITKVGSLMSFDVSTDEGDSASDDDKEDTSCKA